jgi:enoyl-CoA hydratase/carnithine racemase
VDVERWNRCLDELERLPQVTVACLHGAVVGGGLVLAAACDLRLAAPDLRVSLPEVFLGLPLAMGGLARLSREIGLPRTRELVLTRRALDATTSLDWGLVHRVGVLDELVEQLVHELLGAPQAAQSMARQALARWGRQSTSTDGVWSDADVLSLVRMATESGVLPRP